MANDIKNKITMPTIRNTKMIVSFVLFSGALSLMGQVASQSVHAHPNESSCFVSK